MSRHGGFKFYRCSPRRILLSTPCSQECRDKNLFNPGGYDPILKQLNNLKVHHLTMEFTAPGAGDMAVFKKLREDFEIGLGCVSVAPGQVDSAETIVSRVKQACQFLAPKRITLNPDCGFAPGSGAVVSIDEAYQKIRNEVAAAEILRAQF